MPGNARLTDLWAGVCCCHPPIPCIGMAGPIVTSSPNVNTNSLPQARQTDVDIGFCGHPGIIACSSGNTYVNSLGVARLGDCVVGCTIGAIVTASGNVYTNG